MEHKLQLPLLIARDIVCVFIHVESWEFFALTSVQGSVILMNWALDLIHRQVLLANDYELLCGWCELRAGLYS